MIIDQNLIALDLDVKNKDEAISRMAAMAQSDQRLSDIPLFCQKVKEREEQVSTDMGFGIAIPHGRTDAVTEAFVVFAKMKTPIVWNEAEGSKVDLIFMLGSPENSEDNIHLVILSQLATKLMDEDFLEELRAAEKPEDILKHFESMKV